MKEVGTLFRIICASVMLAGSILYGPSTTMSSGRNSVNCCEQVLPFRILVGLAGCDQIRTLFGPFAVDRRSVDHRRRGDAALDRVGRLLRVKSTVLSSTALTSVRWPGVFRPRRRCSAGGRSQRCPRRPCECMRCHRSRRRLRAALTRRVVSSTCSDVLPASGIQLPSAHMYMNRGGSSRNVVESPCQVAVGHKGVEVTGGRRRVRPGAVKLAARQQARQLSPAAGPRARRRCRAQRRR